MMYKYKVNKKRIKCVLGVYTIVLLLLSIRLYYLQVQPSQLVQGELQNHQTETLSEINYTILDTNGKNMLNYTKKYVLVIDARPFKLNNYEETLEELLALNFIMKSEDPNFNYSDIMAGNGKVYYEITEESYNKIKNLIEMINPKFLVYEFITTSLEELSNFIKIQDKVLGL